ncbi:MAG: cell wall-active antibiotics response protein [Tannerella sp.]|jgi:predicted membrane protein|nr:cell wall-active antibiotics response protein [Tannerella sp.]
MSTTKNKGIISAIFAIILMVGSGILLNWAINTLFTTATPFFVISMVLLSILIYVAGATLMSRSVSRHNGSQSYTHNKIGNGVIFALLLIGTGILLLCFNTGWLAPVWKSVFFSWPMLLLIIGIIHICKFHFIWGIILAAIGKFFLFSEISKIYPDTLVYEQFLSTYWPAGIILLGILIFSSLIIRPTHFRKRSSKGHWNESYVANEQENQDGKINYQFIFSGTEQVILDPEFKGGNIDVTFGGMELDLRHTSLPEGETFLYINALFGGVEISAPDNWDIDVRSKSFVGGVSDSRIKNIDKDQSRKLILVVKCTFGGIEIK